MYFNVHVRLKPHIIVFVIMWLITNILTIYFLFLGVRNTDEYQGLRYLVQTAYVLSLIWFLKKSGSSLSLLPEIKPCLFPRWRYGKIIPVVFVIILLFLNILTDQVDSMVLLILVITTLLILILWRKEVNFRMIVTGILIGIIAFCAGLPFMKNGMLSKTAFIFFSALIPFLFVAGWLVLQRTRLGGIQLAGGNYMKALKSFIFGCLLFIPLGLLNAAEGSPGLNITWADEFWMPVTLPLFSGIAEETRYRLLLIGLCYYLLRPAFKKYPAIAVGIAVIFSTVTFGLGHGWNIERLLTTGLLYGLPMSVIFVKRDWEHAVGAHYMINLIPWIIVFSGN